MASAALAASCRTGTASVQTVRQPKAWDAVGSLRSLSLPSRISRRESNAAQTTSRAGGASQRRRNFIVQAVSVKALVNVTDIDSEKFKSLVLRRNVYGHDDWRKHKSSGRYFRHIKNILRSKVVSALGPPIFIMTSIASAVVTWNALVHEGLVPGWVPLLHISTLPFSLTAPALSFLLVFRTNSSYGRFDEARKMWGLMLNRSREICRQALTYMARDQYTYEYPKRAQFLRHLQAFPLTYKHHFLQEGSLEEDLRSFTALSDDEIQGLLASTHRPNYCLQMMSECMGRCHMDPVYRLAMESNFATFADDIGGSERLFKTPIPLSYTRLTARFLMIYHLFLPFALYDTLGWLTIPVMAVHTGIFFCIEEVGVLIENPFPVLALDAISQSVRNNVAELVSLHETIRNLVVATDDDIDGAVRASDDGALLPKEPVYIPEPEPENLSEWEEDTAAVLESLMAKRPYVPIAQRGFYSDDY